MLGNIRVEARRAINAVACFWFYRWAIQGPRRCFPVDILIFKVEAWLNTEALPDPAYSEKFLRDRPRAISSRTVAALVRIALAKPRAIGCRAILEDKSQDP
jgi:hypothetical protein